MGLWPHWKCLPCSKVIKVVSKQRHFWTKDVCPQDPAPPPPPFLISVLEIPHQKSLPSLLPPSLLPPASVIRASIEHSGRISSINKILF